MPQYEDDDDDVVGTGSGRKVNKKHNQGKARDVGGIAGERLRSFLERIERLEEEKKGIQDDIKDVFAEAKGSGFDVKVMRQILKERKVSREDRQEMNALIELYRDALGMGD